MHENYDLTCCWSWWNSGSSGSLKELLYERWTSPSSWTTGRGQEILVFRLLPKDTAAEVFTELEDTGRPERLIRALSDRELQEVLDELYG